MSIINTGHLKPIIKLFDSEWNYIQHAFFKLILLLLIWSWKFSNMLKNRIPILRTLVIWVCWTTLSLFPHWISQPCSQKHKNHNKAISGAGRFAQNLRVCKKSQYNVGIVNQEDTINITLPAILTKGGRIGK